ncbi:MAG: glycoside hydrolase family 38 C-terminal domain-containing protein [bacterium]
MKKKAQNKSGGRGSRRADSPPQKELHVISNTHWDREWAYPFQETRLLLLEFMDNLLDLLEKRPDFHSFLMDSQTMCVDDYLDLRPESRERIQKQVEAGRLIVGPWYSLPEEYIVNGESLVRNLLVGHRLAQSYGKVSKLGYTPFSYGQTSQMPQIYHGFDIDTIIFYRGINTPHSEFIMEGADGSQVYGTRFGALSRFSYYFYLYRNVVQGMSRDEWWYTWQKGAEPFRLCTERDHHGHYYVLDPGKKLWLSEKIPEMIKRLLDDESEHFTTPYIACMQGFDSSEPDPREIDLIEACKPHMPEGVSVFQSSLHEYMEKLKVEIKNMRNPTIIRGESRDPGATGKWTHLMGDVLSSRCRIKRNNHEAETLVQRWAEPFAALAWSLGADYPTSAVSLAWKYILQNHPHDTICGAGADQMEKDLHYRFDQSRLISKGLMRRGMQEIQKRIDNSDVDVKDAVITVFNPSPFPRGEVITAYVDLPDGSDYEAFSIRDTNGQEAARQDVSHFPCGTLVRNLQDISLEQRAERVLLHFETNGIPALGYKTFHIRHEELDTRQPGSLVAERNCMENEHLHVRINSNGTLCVTHKETGHVFDGLHYIEDCGEVGHSWIHMFPEHDEILTSHAVPVDIALEDDGPLLARYRVDYHMQIPVDIEKQEDGFHRSSQRTEVVVTSRFTLRKGARFIHVKTTVNNPCKQHRLRVVFPTHLQASVSSAEAAFDVIDRRIERPKGSLYYGKPNPTYPMHRFVSVSDKRVGFTLFNNGIREYEVTDNKARELALTLLRAFEFKQSPVIDRWDIYPDSLMSQCLGEHDWSYGIYPHAGTWDKAEVYQQAEQFTLPLEAAQAGPKGGDLPKECSFLQVEPADITMSTLKHAEDRESIIFRLYNPTSRAVQCRVTVARPIQGAWLTNLDEKKIERLEPKENTLSFPIPKKKIVTIEIKPKGRKK